MKQLVEVELSQHVSPEALHQLKRHAPDVSSKIETLQKVNAGIAKSKADMESLGIGRIPNGTRPTPMPYESHFLDDLMPVRRDWSFTIPQGSSIRETKQILHCQYMWFMKEMDAQVADAQRQELRSFTKKSSFVERCQSLRSKQQSLWHSLDLDFEADDSEFTSALDLMLLQQKSNRCISAPLTELPQLYRGRMHWTQRLPNPKKTKFSSC